MQISKNDYLVLKTSANKPILVRCLAEGKTYKGIDEKDYVDGKTTTTLEFSRKDVIVNLGPNPTYGSVYGINVEPLKKRIPSGNWNEIRFFRNFDDSQCKVFMKHLNTFRKKLQAKGYWGVPTEVEVRPPKGKYAGMYKHNGKAEFDKLIVRPDEDFTEIEYILAHEYAHGIMFRLMLPKMRSRWIRLYHEYLVLTKVKNSDLIAIREDIEQQGSFRSFLSQCSDEDKLIVKACLKNVQQIHGLAKDNLDFLLSVGETLTDCWPATSIELSEKEVAITDYAMKSYEEFFAEAFSHHFVGKKLPKKVEALLVSTLSKLNKNGARNDD